MKGCHLKNSDLCRDAEGVLAPGSHCWLYWPLDSKRVKINVRTKPEDVFGDINVPKWPQTGVLYNSICVETDSVAGFGGSNSAYCGRAQRLIGCNPSLTALYDFRPSGISFEPMRSDTWFCYEFDMGQWGGTVGTPCFHLEEESSATTGGSGADSTVAGSECHPCTGFYATPKIATCSYENPEGDETGDPDCPYPTMFGVGTLSNKIVFSYDAFSSILPNGVTDINFVYATDSIDVDVWDADDYNGAAVVTSQNPWKTGDETFTDNDGTILIFEGAVLESGSKQGLRVKVRMQPVYDYDLNVWTGTRWEFLELMAPGQNYAVNDTYTLNYTHTHSDNTTSVITIDIKITAVGPIEGVSPQAGFDALREGDTINGHTITKVFHTDFDVLQRHLVYLDGNGNDFTYNTQYTSNRAHQITVYAGKGVKTHSALLGLYEFYDKSVQFTTESIDGGSPDVYNTLKQPIAEGIITNGTISGFNVYSGGSGWDKLGAPPELVCTTPAAGIGKEAELEVEIRNGALSFITVTDPGIGYTSAPTVTISGNATAVAEVDSYNGVVNRIRITDHGSGYTANPTVTFSGGGGSGAVATATYGDGVVVGITIKNQGSGYSTATDEPRAYVSNIYRVDTLKITEGIDESETGIESFNEKLRASGGFPEMVNALDRDVDKAVDASRKKAYQSKSTTAPQPNSESLTDFTKNDIYTLPQRRYKKETVDEYEKVVTKYGIEGVNDVQDITLAGVEGLGDSDVTPEYKKEMANYRAKTKEAEETRLASIKQQCKALAQESDPEYLNYAGTLVETVQRRFSDLPHASTLTKYHIRQYRASTTPKIEIKVKIGCKVVESGCGHITCNAPATTAGSTTNNNDGSTTTKTYTMSGLLGPGAEDWEASGSLLMLNDLSQGAINMSACVEAYGNPFDIS